ncbi:MAG: lysophospholipid acyltransferase family protein, partial [Smithella sp.]
MKTGKTTKIHIVTFALHIIPLPLKRALAVLFSRLFYRLSLKHRLIAIHNLTRSFPDKSPDEIIRIVKDSNATFALTMLESSDLLYLNKHNLHRRVSVRGMEHYEKACQEGKGVLLFSAHFGNWEFGNAALAILSKPPIFMARILDSHFIEEASTYMRASLGIGNLHKENALRPMLRLLKNGEAIKLLIDQNVAVYEGVFVDYFGRPACTTSGIALLALRTGAAVLPIFTTRMPDGRYLTEIGPKVETVNTGDRDHDVLVNTQNYTKIIEDHVRKYPRQWLWMHQRWKTKRWQKW